MFYIERQVYGGSTFSQEMDPPSRLPASQYASNPSILCSPIRLQLLLVPVAARPPANVDFMLPLPSQPLMIMMVPMIITSEQWIQVERFLENPEFILYTHPMCVCYET